MPRRLNRQAAALSLGCLFSGLAAAAGQAPRAVVFGSSSGRYDAELIAASCFRPSHARFDIPFTDAGGWLEPAEFARYRLVVVCTLKGDGTRAWTDEEVGQVETFVRDGGTLVLVCAAPMKLAGKARDVTRLGRLLGGTYLGREAADAQVLAPEDPLVAHLGDAPRPWYGRGLTLRKLTTARTLVGVRTPEPMAGVAVNRLGEGRVLYLGQEWFRLYGSGGREADADAFGEVLNATFRAADVAVPSTREAWDLQPLGPKIEPRSPGPPKNAQALPRHFRTVQAAGEPVPLIRAGRPVCAIVTGDDASRAAVRGARELVEALERVTGAAPPLWGEPELMWRDGEPVFPDKMKGVGLASAVVVGDSRAARDAGLDPAALPDEGYRIASRGRTVFIFGRDVTDAGLELNGTLHGVVAFLERHVGFRWLWPGELGEVVPEHPDLAVGPLDESDAPALRQRRLRNAGLVGLSYFEPGEVEPGSDGDAEYPEIMKLNPRLRTGLRRMRWSIRRYQAHLVPTFAWFARQRLGGSLNVRYTHAYNGWWEKHGGEHPEWFALQPNGTRAQEPPRERFCVSNAGLAEAVAREKLVELAADPTLTAGSISPNDGSSQNNFCMCRSCRRLDSPNGTLVRLLFTRGRTRFYRSCPSLSDRYVTFYSRVAEHVARERPDRLLGAYAYSAYRSPPLHAAVHPSLLIGFVGLGYFDDAQLRVDRERWDGWAAKASHLFLRPNLFHGGHGFPAVFVTKLARDVRHCYETGMMATDFDSVLHHWATHGLNYYVLAKLLWDPGQDSETIVRDYCEHGFGPAAAEVRRYFAELERLTDEIAAAAGRVTEGELRPEEAAPGQPVELWQFYTPERLSALRDILGRARAAAAGDSAVIARIDFLALGLEYARHQFGVRRLRQEGADVGEDAGRRVMDERHRFFTTLLTEQPLAVNVVHLVWREGTTFTRAFAWEPGKPGK